jgi:hypothetical protein
VASGSVSTPGTCPKVTHGTSDKESESREMSKVIVDEQPVMTTASTPKKVKGEEDDEWIAFNERVVVLESDAEWETGQREREWLVK